MEFEATETRALLRVASLNRWWAGPVLDDFQLVAKEVLPRVPAGRRPFDVAADFSTNANPNGVWRCGWKSTTTSPFLLLTTAHRYVEKNGWSTFSWQLNDGEPPAVSVIMSESPFALPGCQSQCLRGDLLISPGTSDAPENFGVVRFMAPSNGQYRVQVSAGSAFEGGLQGDADFHVLTNNTEVFGLYLAPQVSAAFTNDFNLVAGDAVDFLVGRGWDRKDQGSVMRISAQVFPLGEPTSGAINFGK